MLFKGVDKDWGVRTMNTDECHRPNSVSTLNKPALKENGVAKPPMDDATRLRAEGSYPKYYEYFGEADANAQGTASFN